MSFLDGYHTYIAAIGFVGLAVYQFTQGQIEQGLESLTLALTAFGIKRSAVKVENKVDRVAINTTSTAT